MRCRYGAVQLGRGCQDCRCQGRGSSGRSDQETRSGRWSFTGSYDLKMPSRVKPIVSANRLEATFSGWITRNKRWMPLEKPQSATKPRAREATPRCRSDAVTQ